MFMSRAVLLLLCACLVYSRATDNSVLTKDTQKESVNELEKAIGGNEENTEQVEKVNGIADEVMSNSDNEDMARDIETDEDISKKEVPQEAAEEDALESENGEMEETLPSDLEAEETDEDELQDGDDDDMGTTENAEETEMTDDEQSELQSEDGDDQLQEDDSEINSEEESEENSEETANEDPQIKEEETSNEQEENANSAIAKLCGYLKKAKKVRQPYSRVKRVRLRYPTFKRYRVRYYKGFYKCSKFPARVYYTKKTCGILQKNKYCNVSIVSKIVKRSRCRVYYRRASMFLKRLVYKYRTVRVIRTYYKTKILFSKMYHCTGHN